MPENTRVHHCAEKVEAEGKSKGSAIAICQASTHQNYHTGGPIKKEQTSVSTKKDPFVKASTHGRLLAALRAQASGRIPKKTDELHAPVKKCESCGKPLDRHDHEDNIKMAEGKKLSIGKGTGLKPSTTPPVSSAPPPRLGTAAPQSDMQKTETALGTGQEHLSAPIESGLSTAKFLAPHNKPLQKAAESTGTFDNWDRPAPVPAAKIEVNPRIASGLQKPVLSTSKYLGRQGPFNTKQPPSGPVQKAKKEIHNPFDNPPVPIINPAGHNPFRNSISKEEDEETGFNSQGVRAPYNRPEPDIQGPRTFTPQQQLHAEIAGRRFAGRKPVSAEFVDFPPSGAAAAQAVQQPQYPVAKGVTPPPLPKPRAKSILSSGPRGDVRDVPLGKPVAPPPGLSAAAGAASQVAASNRYQNQAHIKAPIATPTHPIAQPVQKGRLDRPFAGRPSATRPTKKGVDR